MADYCSDNSQQKKINNEEPLSKSKHHYTANKKIPFWATEECRRLILFGVLGITMLAVVAEILYSKRDKSSNENNLNIRSIAKFEPKESQSSNSGLQPFEGILSDVQDYTPINEEMLKEKGYEYLLYYLKSIKPEDLKQKAHVVDYSNYFEETSKIRGQIVSITGLIVLSDPIRLPKPLPGNQEFIYRTYIVDPSGNEGSIIDLLEKPVNFELRRDLVRIYGIFYKIAKYEGRKGEVEAPISLGIKVVHVKEKLESSSYTVGDTALAIIVVCFLGVGYLTIRLLTSRQSKTLAFNIGSQQEVNRPKNQIETIKKEKEGNS